MTCRGLRQVSGSGSLSTTLKTSCGCWAWPQLSRPRRHPHPRRQRCCPGQTRTRRCGQNQTRNACVCASSKRRRDLSAATGRLQLKRRCRVRPLRRYRLDRTLRAAAAWPPPVPRMQPPWTTLCHRERENKSQKPLPCHRGATRAAVRRHAIAAGKTLSLVWSAMRVPRKHRGGVKSALYRAHGRASSSTPALFLAPKAPPSASTRGRE